LIMRYINLHFTYLLTIEFGRGYTFNIVS